MSEVMCPISIGRLKRADKEVRNYLSYSYF